MSAPIDGERAINIENTMADERAILMESTKLRERAINTESAKNAERAVAQESTNNDERADIAESTKAAERANPAESTKIVERTIIPRGGMREYLIILGITAIYGAVLPVNPGFVGVSRDLHLSAVSLRRRFTGATIGAVFWVRDADRAEAIRRETHAQMLPLTTALLQRHAIVNTADKLGIAITEHAMVMERVSFVVQSIENKIEQAAANGDLGWFNQAFRKWRLEARAQGRTMSYAEGKARLRRVLMHGMIKHNETLLPAIFPTLFA